MGVAKGSTEIADVKLGTTQVDKIYLGSNVVWQKTPPIKALKFTSPGEQTLGIGTGYAGYLFTVHFEYSNDGETWSTWEQPATRTLSFGNGVDLYLRGMNNTLNINSSDYIKFVFSTNNPVYCSGNVMHLLDYTQDLTSFPVLNSSYGISSLFRDCTVLVTAPNLPAISTIQHAYDSTFMNCPSLTTPPVISASSIANYCCQYMFYGCTSLTTPPVLSATSVGQYAYYEMFYNCTSLTTAPALPASAVPNSAYRQMFQGCTNLETIPALPATTIGDYCYSTMFYGCSKIKMATTQSDEYPNTFTFGADPTSASNATYRMFRNTGGTFTGTPNTQTYYTANTIIS